MQTDQSTSVLTALPGHAVHQGSWLMAIGSLSAACYSSGAGFAALRSVGKGISSEAYLGQWIAMGVLLI